MRKIHSVWSYQKRQSDRVSTTGGEREDRRLENWFEEILRQRERWVRQVRRNKSVQQIMSLRFYQPWRLVINLCADLSSNLGKAVVLVLLSSFVSSYGDRGVVLFIYANPSLLQVPVKMCFSWGCLSGTKLKLRQYGRFNEKKKVMFLNSFIWHISNTDAHTQNRPKLK